MLYSVFPGTASTACWAACFSPWRRSSAKRCTNWSYRCAAEFSWFLLTTDNLQLTTFSMPEQLPFTALLNRIFAAPVDALLRALHIEPKFPQAPISNAIAMEVLVVGFLVLVFLLLRARLSVDNPGRIQHIFEGLHG